MSKHTVIIPLYRVGVSKVDLAESLGWGCPILADDNETAIVSRFYCDPAVIERLYS